MILKDKEGGDNETGTKNNKSLCISNYINSSSSAVTVADIAMGYGYKIAMIKVLTKQVNTTATKVIPLVKSLKLKVRVSQYAKEAQAEILNKKIELATHQLGTLSDMQGGLSDTVLLKSKQMVFDNWMASYDISKEEVLKFEGKKKK